MALPKFLRFFIFIILFYTVIASTELSDSVVVGEVIGAVSGAEAADDFLRVELDQLKASDASRRDELDELNSKISIIASKINERMQELISKEKTIKELEMIIEEKSDILTALQNHMQLIKKKATWNAKAQEVRAYAHARELEEQINNLQKEIEGQNKNKDALEARATIAERKIQDLNLKLENLHRTNDEQKSRILSTQRALQVAEEEFMKVKLEAASILKQLIKSFVMNNWNEHGRPALKLTKEKALEKKSEYEKWLRPHVDTFKSVWVPYIKEKWLTFLDEFGVHLQTFTNLTIDKYHVSKESIEPHALRLKEVTRNSVEPYVLRLRQGMHPYFQEVKKFMEPYMKTFLRGYRKFVGEVNALHQQIQATILDILKGHQLTRPLATKELVRCMAAALMALPLIFLFNMVCAPFLEKSKKRVSTSHSSHARCRPKRLHSER